MADVGLAEVAVEFVAAAVVPVEGYDHQAGTLERANELLAAHPGIAGHDVFIAAILGDDAAVTRFVEADRSAASAKGGPKGWDPLTYLCFSRYVRSDASRRESAARTARVLLEHGAPAQTGFYLEGHGEAPSFESAIYGAAGIANHVGLTKLLLEHGADPNDDETPYHVPERYENDVLELLVTSGRLVKKSVTTMLARKYDWHDYDAVAWLLAHGADPNDLSMWGRRSLHQALERDNAMRFFELLREHGADPRLANRAGRSALSVAARMGRADVLDFFAAHGEGGPLDAGDTLLAAAAHGDAERVRALAQRDPALVHAIQDANPATLADFAGAGNTAGVALLLDLGFDLARVTSRAGAQRDTPLHAAVVRARQATARLLITRGAPLAVENGHGETPLAYAVRALHLPWIRDKSTETIEALLAAGADARRVKTPTGIAAVDALLAAR